MTMPGLLHGIVVESHTDSWTGRYLYSDVAIKNGEVMKNSTLNNWAQIPIIGILAGVARIALAIIHSLGHLIAALCTLNKGHLYHAAKGGCEMLRGLIEALPLIGRVFSCCFNSGSSWWMIKMYNPEAPDGLDLRAGEWNNWHSGDLARYYYVAD